MALCPLKLHALRWNQCEGQLLSQSHQIEVNLQQILSVLRAALDIRQELTMNAFVFQANEIKSTFDALDGRQHSFLFSRFGSLFLW